MNVASIDLIAIGVIIAINYDGLNMIFDNCAPVITLLLQVLYIKKGSIMHRQLQRWLKRGFDQFLIPTSWSKKKTGYEVACQPLLLALEPRIMFDGAAVNTAIGENDTKLPPWLSDEDTAAKNDPKSAERDRANSYSTELPGLYDHNPNTTTQDAEDQKSSNNTVADEDLFLNETEKMMATWQNNDSFTADILEKREIIFIDDGIEDFQTLIDGIDNQQVVILDSAQDGITQIASALVGARDLDAIHIFSHGSHGQMALGDVTLSVGNIDQYAEVLSAWGTALADDGDILLYGCNVGGNTDGINFVRSLAEFSGADVVASDDRTGSLRQGYDWDLEVSAGKIETGVAIDTATQRDYFGVLESYTVTNTSDNATTPVAGSLRAAIDMAADTAENDTIAFATNLTGQTITLDNRLSYSIDFATRGNISIDGDTNSDNIPDITISGGNSVGIFYFDPNMVVNLDSLTLTQGSQTGSGGAINNGATLTINDSIITANQSTINGGGIYNNGTLTVNTSTISNNTTDVIGGAITTEGAVTITNSTISGNSSVTAGGIAGSTTETISITGSTISGNTATDLGGGIYQSTTGAFNITNSTISGNQAAYGGGVSATDNGGSTITIKYSTITNNTATISGGGVNADTNSNVSLAHTIVTGNLGPNPDFSGSSSVLTSAGYNLIGDAGSSGFTNGVNNDIVGTAINADLQPLRDNSGVTYTHALGVNSAAINAGNPAAAGGVGDVLSTDQRGYNRVMVGNIDIGAYESPIFVTDSSDSGAGTLRQAIADASNGDVIGFNPTAMGGYTVNLTSTNALYIAKQLTIDGDIDGDNRADITIDANANAAAFTFDTGSANVTINSLNIVNGLSAWNGGGIYVNGGTANIFDTTLSGHTSTVSVGAIRISASSTVNITRSTISGNTPNGDGAIRVDEGATLTLTNTTISGNNVNDANAAINNLGNLTVRYSTITNNVGEYDNDDDTNGGGGITTGGGGVTILDHSIIANNSNRSVTSVPKDLRTSGGGTITSNGYNLIGSADGVTIGGTLTGNQVGTDASPLDPLLAALADNGGTTLTHALTVGSVAINAGNGAITATVPTTDQRGQSRQVGTIDIGAYEAQTPIGGFAGALDFDGVDDYVDVTDVAALRITSAFTEEAWINLTRKASSSISASNQAVLVKGDNNYFLTIGGPDEGANAGKIVIGGYNGAGTLDRQWGNTVVDDGQWHHIAGVFDGATWKIYVDGQLDVSNSSSISDIRAAGPGSTPSLHIGKGSDYYSQTQYVQGQLREVRLWNIARDITAIQSSMSDDLLGVESGLLGYWKFADATGTSAADSSRNGHTGTLLNMTTSDWITTTTYTTNEDTQVTVFVVARDNDSTDTLTAQITALPSNGTLYQTNDGSTLGTEITAINTSVSDSSGWRRVIFVPNANANGADSFQATISDGTLTSSAATFNLSVNAISDAPQVSGTYSMAATNEDITSPGVQISSIISGIAYTEPDSGDSQGIAATAVSGTGTWQFSTNNSDWTDFGSVSGSASLLLSSTSYIRFAPTGNYNGSAGITFRGWDQTTDSASTQGSPQTADSSVNGSTTAFSSGTADVSLAVTGVNDAPVLDNSGAPVLTTIAEDPTSNSGTLVSALTGAAISDVDSGAATGIVVTSVDNTNGSWQFSVNNGTDWTAFGVASQSSGVVLTVTANDLIRFVPSANYTGTATIGYQAWDTTDGNGSGTTNVDVTSNGGSTAYSNVSETATISVSAVNDAPVLDSTGSPVLTTIAEDPTSNSGTLVSALTGATISDADSGATTGIVVTSVDNTNGSWQFSVNNGTDWTAFGVASQSSGVVLTVTANDLIRFVPSANYTGTATIGYQAWDTTDGNGSGTTNVDVTSNGGSTAYSNVSETATISVSAVNDAPVVSGTYSMSATNEDTTSTSVQISSIISGISYAEADSGASQGIAVTTVSGTGSWQYSTNDSDWTDFGSVSSNASLLLDSDSTIRFAPGANYNGLAGITFRGWDQTANSASTLGSPQTADASINGSGTAFSSESAAVSLTVTSVNDAPALSNNVTLTTIDEDSLSPTSATINSLVNNQFSDVDGAASLSGVLIVQHSANTATQGEWQYSSDNANWKSIGSISDDSNALALSTSASIRFLPTSNFYGTPGAISIRVLDDSFSGNWSTTTDGLESRATFDASGNGGASAISADIKTISTTVNPVADIPQVNNITTVENTQSNVMILDRNASDGSEVTYFLINNISSGALYHNDGTTRINNGSYITYAEGNAGVRFTPTTDSTATGSFGVQSSLNNTSVSNQSSVATASITVTPGAVTSEPVNTTTENRNVGTESPVSVTELNRNAGNSEILIDDSVDEIDPNAQLFPDDTTNSLNDQNSLEPLENESTRTTLAVISDAISYGDTLKTPTVTNDLNMSNVVITPEVTALQSNTEVHEIDAGTGVVVAGETETRTTASVEAVVAADAEAVVAADVKADATANALAGVAANAESGVASEAESGVAASAGVSASTQTGVAANAKAAVAENTTAEVTPNAENVKASATDAKAVVTEETVTTGTAVTQEPDVEQDKKAVKTIGDPAADMGKVIADMNKAGLSRIEKQEIIANVSAENIVSGFQNSKDVATQKVGAILNRVAGGEHIEQATLVHEMQENQVDRDTIMSNLMAFVEVQKDARTQLYQSAIAGLDQVDEVNVFLPVTENAPSSDDGQINLAAITGLPQISSGDKVAILIGISDYHGPIPDLNTPINDVNKIGGVFENKGYKSIILENATQKEIIEVFRSVADKVDTTNKLTVYFAGHGYQNEETGTGYWLPSNAKADSSSEWVSTKHVSDYLQLIKAKQILLISDSCFSGTLTQEYDINAESSNLSQDEIRNQRSVMVMSSGGEEPVMDGGGDGHSVFAGKMISAMQNIKVGDTGADLFKTVKQQVVEVSPQTPQYGAILSAGHEKGGDYIFER